MTQRILFYDGDCGFCNRSVQLVLNHATHGSIHFAPLQSPFATSFFQEKGFPLPDLSTVYFWDGKNLSNRSTAALKIARHLKWYFQLTRIGWLLPRFIRDGIYNWIAKRRMSLANAQCLLPTAEQRELFLDR